MLKRHLAGPVAGALVAAALATAPIAPANAQRAAGTDSLAALLAADGQKLDKNWKDFDILDAAVTAVLADDEDSAVAVLADGKTKLTAFAPTDKAFRMLVKDLSGKTYKSESRVVSWLAENAGLDTIETVLLYHVVPGKALDSKKVLKSNGAKLKTAAGSTFKVKVKTKPSVSVTLQDKDKNAQDPMANLDQLDLNKGNKQIAHGIDRVLRPIDL